MWSNRKFWLGHNRHLILNKLAITRDAFTSRKISTPQNSVLLKKMVRIPYQQVTYNIQIWRQRLIKKYHSKVSWCNFLLKYLNSNLSIRIIGRLKEVWLLLSTLKTTALILDARANYVPAKNHMIWTNVICMYPKFELFWSSSFN